MLWQLFDRLYYPIQRYKFESNSQLTPLSLYSPVRCIIRYKDTNLKAIHNGSLGDTQFKGVVLSDTKIQIWKQFTTLLRSSTPRVWLYYPIQRYKFESNSQRWRPINHYLNCCIIRYKDTNLKAIHNSRLIHLRSLALYYPIQRYKFESNSQRVCWFRRTFPRCIIRYKDTNLKAIHNGDKLNI